MLIKLSTLMIALFLAISAYGRQDLFDEEEIFLGFKMGGQLTRYSARDRNVEPRLYYAFGAETRLVYKVPQIEFDILWNVRGWPGTKQTLESVSLPLLVTFPVEMIQKVFVAVGLGYESDIILSAPGGHPTALYGVLFHLGTTVDFTQWLLHFDIRYNYGLTDPSTDFQGGRPQDLQIFLGPLWHF